MRNVTIRTKLIAAFATMGLLLVGQGLLSVDRFNAVNELSMEIKDNWLPATRAAGAMATAAALHRLAEARVVLAANETERSGAERDYDKRQGQMKEWMDRYAPTVTAPEERAMFDEVRAKWDAYLADAREVAALGRKGQAAEAAALYKGRSRDTYNAANSAIDRLVEFNVKAGTDASRRADEIHETAELVLDVMMAAGALLAAVAAWLANLSVSVPVRRMTDAMERLADGDAAVEIPSLGRGDEIGAMAGAVAVFKENLIRNRQMEQEAKEAEARAAAEKRRSMLELAQRFEDRVGGVVNAVGSAATELQATAAQLAAAVEEVSAQCTTVAAASEQASANVQTVAAASEEMSASIHELSGRVGQAAGRSRAAAEGAGLAQRELDALATAIDQVDQIVSAINAVASQTNLLALNATIEAARAGEAGKGFAVVASEVKNLANQTHSMTEQIASNLAAVKGASGRTVEAMRAIIGQVGEIDQSTAEMAASVEQQSAATGEISRNAQQAAVGTQEVSSNVCGIQRAGDDTSAATGSVKDAADGLAGQAAVLKREVDDFLAEIRNG